MKALFRFHLRAGVRMGLRASAGVFAALTIWTILQSDPAAAASSVARAAFGRRTEISGAALFIALSFLLPAWAVGRLSSGLNGWLRHLPISSTNNRRGLMLALISVQLPLIVMLVGGALLALSAGNSVTAGAVRWCIILMAGAAASLPVERKRIVVALAVVAVFTTLIGSSWWLALPVALLSITTSCRGRFE